MAWALTRAAFRFSAPPNATPARLLAGTVMVTVSSVPWEVTVPKTLSPMVKVFLPPVPPVTVSPALTPPGHTMVLSRPPGAVITGLAAVVVTGVPLTVQVVPPAAAACGAPRTLPSTAAVDSTATADVRRD
ncbi:hypothetical protein [Streptomyces clavuligerus]|uniref:hypothetical protein n=1 Tax=Streptomyces clavuligerus TaxID=1901 RepID=UPI00020D9412|nr:hypothetical protein [Streptomyces clavuligerus]WDN56097.1 hypothetical protein LL058_29975 [Streptomyces clavuligerus]